MAITTDAPVPHEVLEEILALDGFVDGRADRRSRSRLDVRAETDKCVCASYPRLADGQR